jgi:hypothetical protein
MLALQNDARLRAISPEINRKLENVPSSSPERIDLNTIFVIELAALRSLPCGGVFEGVA